MIEKQEAENCKTNESFLIVIIITKPRLKNKLLIFQLNLHLHTLKFIILLKIIFLGYIVNWSSDENIVLPSVKT